MPVWIMHKLSWRIMIKEGTIYKPTKWMRVAKPFFIFNMIKLIRKVIGSIHKSPMRPHS